MNYCRRPPKKSALNGFALYRRQVGLELRQGRERVNEEQLTLITAQRWEDMDDLEKEHWKAKAKEEKMRGRNEAFAAYEMSLINERNQGQNGGGPQNNLARAQTKPRPEEQEEEAWEDESDFPAPPSGVQEKALASSGPQEKSTSDTGPQDKPTSGPQEKSSTGPQEKSASPSIRPPQSSSFVASRQSSVNGGGASGPGANGGQAGGGAWTGTPPAGPSSVIMTSSAAAANQNRSNSTNLTFSASRWGNLRSNESILKLQEDYELSQNPEKRRANNRKAFLRTFTWKYEQEKDVLMNQKFYYLTAQVLHFASNGRSVPAEMSCVEFTLSSGITNYFSTPILPIENFTPSQMEEIKRRAEQTHGFQLPFLRDFGASSNNVASKFIQMSHNREPSCRNIRFFCLQSEFTTVFSCLSFLLENSDVEEKYKELSVNDIAFLDDLAHGFFKFFEVDYSNGPQSSDGSNFGFSTALDDPLDLDRIFESIDGQKFTSYLCEFHEKYQKMMTSSTTINKNKLSGASGQQQTPVCCLSKQRLIVEIIKSSVERRRLDDRHLKEFVELNLALDAAEPQNLTAAQDIRDKNFGGPIQPFMSPADQTFKIVVPLTLPATTTTSVSSGTVRQNLNRVQSVNENDNLDTSATATQRKDHFQAQQQRPEPQNVPAQTACSTNANVDLPLPNVRQLTIKKAERLRDPPMSYNPDEIFDEDFEEDTPSDDSEFEKYEKKSKKKQKPGSNIGGFTRLELTVQGQAQARRVAISSKSKIIESRGMTSVGRGRRHEESKAFFATPTEFPTTRSPSSAPTPTNIATDIDQYSAPDAKHRAVSSLSEQLPTAVNLSFDDQRAAGTGGGDFGYLPPAATPGSKAPELFMTPVSTGYKNGSENSYNDDDNGHQPILGITTGQPMLPAVTPAKSRSCEGSFVGGATGDQQQPQPQQQQQEYYFDFGGLEYSADETAGAAAGPSRPPVDSTLTIVPDTMSVQQFLAPGQKGIGRGLHLLPEGALLRMISRGKQGGSAANF